MSTSSKPNYDSEEWDDVVPIPQNEGGINPLAAIAYSEEYSQASDYLRAVMAVNEKSHRVLALTEHIISMNPAHYTVWVYRASVLEHLQIPPQQELKWLTAISLKYLKNYQIWQHRQAVISRLSEMPEDEPDFTAQVLAKDVKNYHVFAYRQWLVRHFNLWAEDGIAGDRELAYTEKLLEHDVRNNSAWNHRFFVIFSKPERNTLPEAVVDREIQLAKDKIHEAPQNQSAWNYLQGVMKRGSRPQTELKQFASKYADVDRPDDIQSSHALDILASIFSEERENEKATHALSLLANRYDPIRKKYWLWRKAQIPKQIPSNA